MIKRFQTYILFTLVVLLINLSPFYIKSQERKLPDTPLSQEILNILANEISGQIIFNNEVILCGAPWIRDKEEFSTGTLYEAREIIKIAKKYGINTIKLEKSKRDRKIQYPFMGEFWVTKPNLKLIARLDADAALICSGSTSVNIKAPLIYIPPLDKVTLKNGFSKKDKKFFKGKIALMWQPPRGKTAKHLDEAGIRGVISFNARDRYLDPNQVVYSRSSLKDLKHLKFGFVISWRQWSELLEDIEENIELEVHCISKIETFDDKFETVLAWIPGTEQGKKGLMFCAHLFEGYTKRGANDNMSGCVAQLEILRVLSKLIHNKTLPQPRRDIYFLWPNEISGTFEFIKRNIKLVKNISSNINMDMVGEGLAKNKAVFTFSESPSYLPSYLDGIGDSIMNYLWRSNDIVYSPTSPRGRRGQHFPQPIWEKNGSTDAFRYDIHKATGGSDHICFNNPTVKIPGVELNIWPDQWYHADTDTPDKSDPTQLKRSAFIGAAMALAIANCTDERLPKVLKEVSDYSYKRIGERELPEAFNALSQAKAENLPDAFKRALNLLEMAVEREMGTINSVKDIYSGSQLSNQLIAQKLKQWELYGKALSGQLVDFSRFLYKQNNLTFSFPVLTEKEKKYSQVIPKYTDQVKYKEFRVERSKMYKDYMKAKEKEKKKKKSTEKQDELKWPEKRAILNFIDGKRSILKISNFASADLGIHIQLSKVVKYCQLLKEIGWIEFQD
jgi:hypothetical protein